MNKPGTHIALHGPTYCPTYLIPKKNSTRPADQMKRIETETKTQTSLKWKKNRITRNLWIIKNLIRKIAFSAQWSFFLRIRALTISAFIRLNCSLTCVRSKFVWVGRIFICDCCHQYASLRLLLIILLKYAFFLLLSVSFSCLEPKDDTNTLTHTTTTKTAKKNANPLNYDF